MCRSDLSAEERETTIEELVREITALWQTDELRRKKPSALDGKLPDAETPCWTACMTCVHQRALHVLLRTPAGCKLVHQDSMPFNNTADILPLEPAACAVDSRMLLLAISLCQICSAACC